MQTHTGSGRAAKWGVLLAAAAMTQACASTDTLSDTDLAGRATAVFSVKEPPADRLLGIHRNTRVIVDVLCGDVCPAYTVRIIRYAVDAGPACAAIGGDTASIAVPIAIGVRTQPFCIPHVLYVRKLYVDHPYQKT
jgi:hypothetical protein